MAGKVSCEYLVEYAHTYVGMCLVWSYFLLVFYHPVFNDWYEKPHTFQVRVFFKGYALQTKRGIAIYKSGLAMALLQHGSGQ